MHCWKKKVYELTTQIPRGYVTTYKSIADAVGRPKACRAVGMVLKSNPHPIDIPCHRVVRSNGKIGGYRYGIRKKRELLQSEGVQFVNSTTVSPQCIVTLLACSKK